MNLPQLRIAMHRAKAGKQLKAPDLTPVPDPDARTVSGQEFDRLYLELGCKGTAAALGRSYPSVWERAERRGLRQT